MEEFLDLTLNCNYDTLKLCKLDINNTYLSLNYLENYKLLHEDQIFKEQNSFNTKIYY